MRACELDGVLGGDPSFEVLKRDGLHLIVIEVVPIVVVRAKKAFLCCSVFECGTPTLLVSRPYGITTDAEINVPAAENPERPPRPG